MSSTSKDNWDPKSPEARTYERESSVVFHKTREAFGGLSNMATGYPLHVSGARIPTSEALYQACRFPHMPNIQKLIIQQTSPMTAKMKSKPHRKDSREDWEAVKVAIMKWCLKIKLAQHWCRFSDLLLSTNNKPIIEQSRRDAFWGAIPRDNMRMLEGANVLGRLLMDLRERLKRNPDEFAVVRPLPIPDFIILGRPIGTIERDTMPSLDHSIQRRLQLGR